MSRHVDFDTLQDFREDLLPAEERERVRVHLVECTECQRELEALGSLLDAVGELPMEAQPSRDLWPQIEWRLTGGDTGRSSGRRVETERLRRRITFSAWQLLAASVALALLSGGLVWSILSLGGQGGMEVASEPALESFVTLAGWETVLGGYEEAVTDLEVIFETGREVLDPETLRVLEGTLQTIDQAIRESQEALAQDPGSRFLGRLLKENMRRKVELLRQAAAAVYANT